MGVSMVPGLRTFTRIPRSLSSSSQVRADSGFACAVDAEFGDSLDAGDRSVEEDGAVVVEQRQGLLDGEEGAANVKIESLVEVLLSDVFELEEFAAAGAGEEDVDLAFLALDGFVEAVEVGEVAGVALHSGDVAADEFDGFVELVLTTPGDEDVSTLFNEELRGGQGHAGGCCGNNGYFSIELSHGFSLCIRGRTGRQRPTAKVLWQRAGWRKN
jgi:hypothetical protein